MEAKKIRLIVCWPNGGHDLVDAGEELPENATLLASYMLYHGGDCPLCGNAVEDKN